MSRVALVLGAGGSAGVAYHAGVLAGLSEGLGWDPREADLVVGTSAGSITGTALRAGLSAKDQLARACDKELSAEGAGLMAAAEAARDPEAARDLEPDQFRDGTRRPFGLPDGFPFGLPASPGLLRAMGMQPWRARPGSVMAGMLPAGRIPTTPISSAIRALSSSKWPSQPLWICAVRLSDGRLSVFGREDSPEADVGDAVAASCAIPGYFAPVTIAGVRYVDGGAHSLTNLTVLGPDDFDLVIVSAPMSRAGRLWRMGIGQASIGTFAREFARAQLVIETQRLRRHGTQVVIFSPTAKDRAAMGRNLMDVTRQGAVAAQARSSTLRHLERNEEVRTRLSRLARATT